MGKDAYATFACNDTEVEDALILLKSIKEAKTFKKVLILYDSRIGVSSCMNANIITFSAKSEEALLELIDNYKTFLSYNKDMRLDDIAYTANVGRAKFANRIAITARHNEEFSQKLDTKNWLSGISQREPKICFLFPGTQRSGMGSQLYDTFPVFKEHFDLCSQLIFKMYGLDIKTSLWGDKISKNYLNQSFYSSCSILVIEYCLLKLWASLGVHPDMVVGHSLGEYAAATAASLITLEDALTMIGARCMLIDTLPGGKMLASANKNTSARLIDRFLKSRTGTNADWLDIAAINSEQQTTVSGPPSLVDEFAEFCRNNGVRATILDASHAFHSRGLDPILNEYRDVLSSLRKEVIPATCKYISSVDGTQKSSLSSEYWVSNLRDPVQFIKTSKTIGKHIEEDNSGETYIFLEVGPHPVLSALIQSSLTFMPQCIKSMRKGGNELEEFLGAVGNLFVQGVSINFEKFHAVHNKKKVSLPFYPFQRNPFWFPFQPKGYSTSSMKDTVHPLLGKQIEQPGSGDVKIGDHRIGQWPLMPAAGFAELSLASRYLTLDRNVNHLAIDNFSVQTPGHLTQTGSSYHTLLEGNLVKIYSHCSLDVFPPIQDHYSAAKVSAEAMYVRLTVKGYYFGPSFRCIKSLWEDHMLNKYAEVKLDLCDVDDKLILHPILIDSMLQLVIMCVEDLEAPIENTIKLPVAIRCLKVYNMSQTQEQTDSTTKFYVKKCHNTRTISLYNCLGKKLISMDGIDFLPIDLLSFDDHMHFILNQAKQCPIFEFEWSKDSIQQVSKQVPTSSVCEKDRNWLIFGLHDTFTNDLMGQLNTLEKSVSLITFGQQNKMSTNYIETMGRSQKEFMQILSHFSEIEGIIFGRGLTSALDDAIIERWLHLLQAIVVYSERLSKLLLLTQGVHCMSINAEKFAQKPVAALLIGMLRSFKAENSALNCKLIDLDSLSHRNAVNIMQELFQNPSVETGGGIFYQEGDRLTQKLVKLKRPAFLQLPKASRFCLRLPASNIISDLKLMDMSSVTELEEKGLEIKVNAYSLNFRDIFAVLKQTEAFAKINIIGSDFSGVISRIGSSVYKFQVGDTVFGCHHQNVALSSHISTSENRVCKLPNFLTHEEASTLPTVALTAYQCLCTVAKLKKGDTILIHAASGGVGLAAVQLANTVGANVIATAGSSRKRAYLRNIMGIKHVFDSRNLSFETDISAATDGAGVDIVLNSLTGRGFKEASLNCLRKGGRFIEMSKINVWTKEDCMALRPDVTYSIEDLSLSEDSSAPLSQLENIATGFWQPLPYVHFQAQEIRDALSFLEKAKHIGKVVVSMPDKQNKLFSCKNSYLITGGCGGIEWELIKWMLKNGAKLIFLMGRQIPSSDRQKEISDLNNRGFHVIWKCGDVSKLFDCESIFCWIREQFPQSPLRGIFHCAGVLSDAVFLNQTSETLDKVLCPKFQGGWNLHELSKTFTLQHLVLFSSISSLIGNPGQGNYAAANAFFDALAHYRHALGLPAISLNFGQWGEVGLAAGQRISGLHPMSTKQALAALELALNSKHAQLCTSSMNVTKLVQRIPWTDSFLVNILKSERGHHRKFAGTNKLDFLSSEKFYAEFDACENETDRNSVILYHMGRLVSSVLQLEQNSGINRKFSELGLDSLMMIEIKNKTSNLLGGKVQLSINDFADSEDLENLVKHISNLINTNDSLKQSEDISKLINQDSKLWDHIQISPKCVQLVRLGQVKTIFLTGATGTLGPYMLQQISLLHQVEKIVCLVRPRINKDESSMFRINSRLAFFNLLDRTCVNKIHVVEGDVALIMFGLVESAYVALAHEIDAVVHFAIYGDHLWSYESSSLIKSINVEGTQRIIEFAATYKIKWINAASSIAAYSPNFGVTDKLQGLEEWPAKGNYSCQFGYGISKFIGDRLLS
ncbi:probable polyketide synthase 39 [Folsomia candida]|uniref:probable polyketide synthase 39 n=1 Tax=Folsomia candida TaxID=158441 RepID=UPI000B905C99|nr:probable polyketide synthase 39 [Folsomia candida]